MDQFNKAFDGAHNFSFDKFQFDEPDYNMLMFDEDSYLEHLRVQAAGLAYYGTLAKEADRNLDDMERRYKIRYNELYAECSEIISRAGKKNGVKDIEALLQCKHENELKQWETALVEARQKKDGVNAFYDGWKSKGFSLNAMTNMITSGLLSPKTTITEEEIQANRKRRFDLCDAHSILNKNKENKNEN